MGGGKDVADGGKGEDRIAGNGGRDTIDGGAGKDVINGGGGRDTITPGAGRDVMEGDGGVDTFVFASVKHAGIGAGSDLIRDMSRKDRIDLREIDANEDRRGDQSFREVDDFTGKAGELRVTRKFVEGDTDGNGKADFRISFGDGVSLDADNLLL